MVFEFIATFVICVAQPGEPRTVAFCEETPKEISIYPPKDAEGAPSDDDALAACKAVALQWASKVNDAAYVAVRDPQYKDKDIAFVKGFVECQRNRKA